MRTASKSIAKIGLSKASQYRNNVFSVASDLEAMIDAYGAENLISMVCTINSDIKEHGHSVRNSSYNLRMNAFPIPVMRVVKPKRSNRVFK